MVSGNSKKRSVVGAGLSAVLIVAMAACTSAPPAQMAEGYKEQIARSGIEDAAISDSIREQMDKSPELGSGASTIEIATHRGEVDLTGRAEGRDEIRRALKIALSTPGVRVVRNEIELQQ